MATRPTMETLIPSLEPSCGIRANSLIMFELTREPDGGVC